MDAFAGAALPGARRRVGRIDEPLAGAGHLQERAEEDEDVDELHRHRHGDAEDAVFGVVPEVLDDRLPRERRDGEHADVGGVLRDVEAPARVDDEHRDDYHQVEADRPASRLQDEHDADDAQRERVGGVGERPEQPGDRFEEREHLLDRPAGVEAEHAHVLDLLEVHNEVGHREERDGDENQVRGRDPVEVGSTKAHRRPSPIRSTPRVTGWSAPKRPRTPAPNPISRRVTGPSPVVAGYMRKVRTSAKPTWMALTWSNWNVASSNSPHTGSITSKAWPRGEPQLEGREGDADGGHGDGEPPRMDRLRSISWRIASVSVSSSGLSRRRSVRRVPRWFVVRSVRVVVRSVRVVVRSVWVVGWVGSHWARTSSNVAAIVERSVRWIRTDRASVRFTRS